MAGFNTDVVWVGSNGHAYGLRMTPATWSAAEIFAKSIGGDLAKANSAALNSEIYSHVSSALPSSQFVKTSALDGGGAAYVWLGASDAAKEGNWVWIDQTLVNSTPTNWGFSPSGSEPDNWGKSQNYMAMGLTTWPYGSPGQWNDVMGSNALYSIIESDSVNLVAGLGNSSITGTRKEIVTYSGKLSEYTISVKSGTSSHSLTTTDHVSARDGTDSLVNIDRLRFSDKSVAFDTAKGEISGEAYRLYKAAFDRVPDVDGLASWIHALDTGMSLNTVATRFLGSDEFQNKNGGANPSSDTLVTLLYKNVLHRNPDNSGYTAWVNALESHDLTKEAVLIRFSESDENIKQTDPLIANGIQYHEWWL